MWGQQPDTAGKSPLPRWKKNGLSLFFALKRNKLFPICSVGKSSSCSFSLSVQLSSFPCQNFPKRMWDNIFLTMFFSLDLSIFFSQYFVNNKEYQSIVTQRVFPALWGKRVHRYTVIPLLSSIILDRWKSLLPSILTNAVINTLLENCCYRYLFHPTENNTGYQICDSWLKICAQKWKNKCNWRHTLKI